jgi:alpha-glucosidase (family GH31 glycosyl hydrolase)
LFFKFPGEDETFKDVEHSFIFGDSLKISPVLEQISTPDFTVKTYFPKGRWVNMNNYTDIV